MLRPARRSRWLALPLTLVLLLTGSLAFTPQARADTNLTIGGEARVSYTGGDSIRVRSHPSYSASVLTTVPEGWLVAVLDGPLSDGAGSQWYKVTARGMTGYMVSDYLARPGGSSTPAEIISYAWVTGGSLNLRASASTSSSVLLVMPNAAKVGVTGSSQNGFTPVRYNGTNGWAYSAYLTTTEPGSGPTPGEVISNAWVTGGSLNLRASASTSSSVLLVMPNAAKVGVTGSPQNGFTPVRYNGTNGWAYSTYLTTTEPGSGSSPGTVIETRFATTSLNLRSGAGTSFSVLRVIPSGAEVGITGNQQNGFFPVRYDGMNGYASATYLSADEPSEPDPGSGNTGGLLVWPVKGGTWEIIQGYNGGTHQNRSSSESYYYSMDIAKVGGGTAGTSVYASASGTVLWTSGGLLIDMGNGYGIAMFHITIDGSIGRGTKLTQGQYVGFISGPGGVGYAVTPHIDLTLWRIPNGGGSPRYSTAYTGQFAISGVEYPDIGTWNMYGGSRFTP